MLKLYNIFENIILEEQKLLTEGMSRDNIIQAIDSNVRYRIWYQGERETVASERLVDFYALGRTKTGNEVVRVFQPFGFTTSQNGKWKLLRLDRITRIEPTKYNIGKKSIDQFDPSIPTFNRSGDASMASVDYIRKVE